MYKFGTPYSDIYKDLKMKDQAMYTRNKVLPMIRRNMDVKLAPERFQDCKNKSFDLIITYEARVFDILVHGTINFYVGQCLNWTYFTHIE
jgi:RNA polymerase II subunit A C-terminal domain phosphatase SSU72